MRVRTRADLVPVEDELAEARVVAPRCKHGVLEPDGRGVGVRVEGSALVALVSRPPPTATSCAFIELRMMKSSDGGSAGMAEKRLTAMSNDPHHAFTAVERPR